MEYSQAVLIIKSVFQRFSDGLFTLEFGFAVHGFRPWIVIGLKGFEVPAAENKIRGDGVQADLILSAQLSNIPDCQVVDPVGQVRFLLSLVTRSIASGI